jgi:glycosyltransferase involved in cell wall biosynthesis
LNQTIQEHDLPKKELKVVYNSKRWKLVKKAMNKFNPKISIIIPVYNGSDFLREAIDSVIAQTYNNIEIIVINDGSNDKGETEKITRSYGKKIRYFKKENGGVATALNLGIEKMTGDYFSWLSHDDKYVPNRTKKMVSRINKELNKEDLILATSFAYFDKSTKFPHIKSKRYVPSHPLSYLFLGYINGCSMLIPKSVLIKGGVFNKNLLTTQDFDLWFRLLRNNKLIYLDEPLTLSRSHEKQGSKAMLEEHIKECDELWISMMKELSNVEKSNIFGDEFSFYSAIYDFLKNNTLYKEAISFAKKEMLEVTKTRVFSEGYKPVFIDDLALNINKNKKTIFFPIFGHYNDRGGLNKMVSMLANRLSEKYNVIIASFTTKEYGYPLDGRVSYIRVSSKFLDVDSFEDISILFDVDIVVVSHNCCKSGLDLISRSKVNNKKVIAWNHENYFLPYINPKYCEIWPIRNDIFAKTDAVLWLTNASCSVYYLRTNNGLVMPNFIHFEHVIKKKYTEVIHNNIIAVARFDDPQKRINKLIEAYEKIIDLRPITSLTILGVVDTKMAYKNNESVGRAIKRVNANGGQIKLAGVVNNIEDYYSKSDVHILPSHYEGFSLTILEGAYFGVPTAVFNSSGFDDIISDGVNGIIAPEADTSILARRVVDLLNDKKKLINMKNSSKEILNKFDEDTIVKKWESLIEAVLDDKKIIFNKYSYNKEMMQKISNGFENSLAEFSNIFVPYLKFSEKTIGLYDKVLVSRTWKYTQALREGAAVARKIKRRLIK